MPIPGRESIMRQKSLKTSSIDTKCEISVADLKRTIGVRGVEMKVELLYY